MSKKYNCSVYYKINYNYWRGDINKYKIFKHLNFLDFSDEDINNNKIYNDSNLIYNEINFIPSSIILSIFLSLTSKPATNNVQVGFLLARSFLSCSFCLRSVAP